MEKMNYPDVMVDIETTSTDPEHGAVIQIAAVRFNLLEGTVDASSMFDRCLAMAPGRYWAEDTRSWWHGPRNINVLRQIQTRQDDPAVVMEAFRTWAGSTPSEPHRLWAKPTTFDFMFLASYFKQFNIPNPFHYRYARDVNSFMCGLARDPAQQNVIVEFNGDAHNALHDVLHQIKMLFAAKLELHG